LALSKTVAYWKFGTYPPAKVAPLDDESGVVSVVSPLALKTPATHPVPPPGGRYLDLAVNHPDVEHASVPAPPRLLDEQCEVVQALVAELFQITDL
jgi:hypothetical protein